jgi:hypothetical protein
MAAFHEVRFPEFIAVGARFDPSWKTSIVEFASGQEQRNQEHEDSKILGDISKAIQTQEEYDVILDFWRARRGKFHGFRVKDWSDYVLFQEPTNPATGDGFITVFQVVQTYEDVSEPPASTAVRPQVRDIIKLRGGTGDPIETPDSPGTIVRNAGSSVTVVFSGPPGASEVFVNTNDGTLTFGTAPSNGNAIDFTGEFDVPMRFDTDRLPTVLEDFNALGVNGLPVKELNLLNP